MKKFLSIFFTVLGVIFFLILLFIAYLFIFDPFNIKPFIFNSNETKISVVKDNNDSDSMASSSIENDEEKTVEVEATSNLSPAQSKALEVVGINPDSVPQSFTTEQLTCFEALLGKERVEEIKAGGTPTIGEFYTAKGCI